MAVNFNEQLTKIMQNSVQSVRASADRKRQNIPTAQTKQTGSSAYQRLVAANRQPTTTKQKNSWEFKADGTRKSFNELTTPEVLTWIGTLPEEERGSAARDFETNYLKNPGSTRYDPYYTDYSNNDEARSLFGVNTFDQEWIDANRGYANYLTFSGENYTTPKKPGAKASDEEKKAYQWWQIANTYEATTQAAESEYSRLRSEIQEMTRISRKAGDRLTADEILQSIDWGDYQTLENLREASAAGKGRYLNRPVQVGDASLKSMVNAALRGEDITDARDFVYGESEYLKNGAANSKYLLPIKEVQEQKTTQTAAVSPYADVTSAQYDPYYGTGSNNTAARELFGVESFDQDWIEANRGLMAYIKFKDEDDTEPVKPGEDATEQEKAAYEYWKIANTYEETTRKAENELATLQSWMQKQAEKLGDEATPEAILDRIDWEDKDWQDEYPTLTNMREVAAAGNARMVNRQVGAGDESLKAMAEGILGTNGKQKAETDKSAETQAPAEEKPKTAAELVNESRTEYGTSGAVNQLKVTLNYLNGLEAQGQLTEELKAKRDEWQAEYDALTGEVAEREAIEERVEAEARENSVDKVVAPLRFLWNRGWTDALRDGEFVPIDDYEEFLRYRANPAAADNADEMAKYDKYSALGERTSLIAEGVATGMDKAATATTSGLEYVLYTLARWDPATKDMTKDEVYASDRMLAALKGWNEQFDKQYIDEETKAELTEEYPVVSLISAGVSEMLKMMGQAGGALPYDPTNMIGAATQYGFGALQNGGAALDLQMFGTALSKWEKAVQTIGKLGEKAANAMPFALDIYGSTYETAISEGATENQAAGAAALNAVISGPLSNAVTSRLTKLGGNITRLFQSRAGKKAAEQGAILATKNSTISAIMAVGRQLLESAVEEGIEEAIEEPIQAGIAKGIYDQDRAWTGEGGVFDAKAMMESGIGGAVAGSMFTITAGASGLLGKPAKTAADQIIEKAENGERIEQSEIDNLEKIEAREAAIQDKAEDIVNADTSAIDEAAAKTQQAAEQAEQAELELNEVQEQEKAIAAQAQPAMDALNQGTASYEDPKNTKVISDARKQMQGALQQEKEKAAALEEAKQQHAEMIEAQNATIQQVQGAARTQATQEVEQELQAEKEAEAQAAAEAKKAEAERPVEPGIRYKTKRSAQLTGTQQSQMDILDKLGRKYGIEIDIVDTLGSGKQGAYAGGRRITVALDAAEQAYVQVGVHEMVHYIKEQSAESYEILKETVIDRLAEDGFELEDELNRRIGQYEDVQAISREEAIDEIVAEAVPAVFTDEDAVRLLAERDRTLVEKVRDRIVEFARMLWEIAQNYTDRMGRTEIAMLSGNREALMDIADALDLALEEAKGAEKRSDLAGVKYSADGGKSHIREQIADARSELNAMEPIGTFDSDAPMTTNRTALTNWAINILSDTNYEVERKGFGVIELGKKQIKGSLSYLKTYGDVAAIVAIPDVLKDGIQIAVHENHKDRQYETYTFAAPVIINGQRGNLAIVVKSTDKNRYKTHRIVMPNGAVFEFEQEKNTEAGSYKGAAENGPLAGSTNSVSDSSIPDSAENVNEKYSISADGDTESLIEQTRAEEKAEMADDATRIANRVKREYKSETDRAEIAAGIDQIIDAYQAHDEAAAAAAADQLARQIVETSVKTDVSHREGYEEIRTRLRKTGFSLTDVQKQEVINRYGGYRDWRNSVMGNVNVKKDAASLDAIWGQLSEAHPEYFPADANEAQMPEYIEKFVQAMKPRYENPYGMDMNTAAADLSLRLQADVSKLMGEDGQKRAQRLIDASESLKADAQARTEKLRGERQQRRQEQFRAITQQIKAARASGSDEQLKQAMADYRKLMGGRSKAADAIDAGIEARKLRREAERLTGIINQLNDMIDGEDLDQNRKKLNAELESYTELRDVMQKKAAALHRQEVIDRAGIDAEGEANEWQMEVSGEIERRMNEDMSETISANVADMRGRIAQLTGRMKERQADYNMTSTLTKQDLAEVFADQEEEIIRHSGLSEVWAKRKNAATEQKAAEIDQKIAFNRDMRQAQARGDTAAELTARRLMEESQDRIDVLESQIRLAEAQEKYSRRIGAESLEKALSEGKLPQPIMEKVIALCKDAGRQGAFNRNIFVQAGEAIRLNTTTAARVWDDLFGDAAPVMRAIYYDSVMDNETDRQRWIKGWRDRISALKLTKEQSALVQEIGEGRLRPEDARYQQADQTVLDAVQVFRQFYDEAHAMATNALVRNGYDRPGKITDYFPHIETQKTWWDKLGIPIENTSLPTSINGLTDSFTPGRQYSGHLEHRYGEATDYDALFGFEQYISGISNVIYHTDDIQRHRQLETEIRAAAKNGVFDGGQRSEHLSEFVKWIHEYTNLLAGKKAWMDRPFEGTAGRAIYTAATRLKNMKGASAVMGNVASAVTNMVPVSQVLAEAPLATVKGIIQMCMGVSNGRNGVPESQYKIRKLGSDSVVQTLYTKYSKFASIPFEWVDLLATNIVVNAYYQDNLQKGMDSETAMRSADSKAARLMGDRSKGAMPNLYGSQIAGFFTQFQLEVANQSQHFRKDIWRSGGAKKAFVTLLASALTGYIWNEINEWLTGRRPAADPIQMGIDIFNTWKNDGSPMEIGQAAYNSLSEMFPYANIGGRPAAFDGIGTFIEALTTEGNDGGDVVYALTQLGYGILPSGGQIKKINTGIQALKEGGVYNASGTQLRYAVPSFAEDPLTALQAIVFGPSSTKSGQAYYGDTPGIVEYGKAIKAAINGEGWTAPEKVDAPGLTVAQTRNYEQARERGATSTEAYANEAAKAAAAKLENKASETENAIEDAEAQARADMEAPEIDGRQIEEQREEAAGLRSEAMPGDELTDFWWERRETPQVQAGIELWRKTGKTWALPYAYTVSKTYTIDGRKEWLGEELLREAETMYEECYCSL